MQTVKEKKPQGNTDMQAMMEAYARLSVPGPMHKLLSGLEGSWITKSKSWMDPDKPPEESTGACENKMLYDGRFLQMEYTDTMMEEPVAGMIIIGFDNNTQKFVTATIGSMGTGIYFFEGPASTDGKTFIQEGHYDEPVMGPMTYRAVTRIVDDNTFMYEMIGVNKSGREMKMMETVYTRKK